eukprot:TRINITY_DN21558_c0_g1_i2.p1 TRINITY_DN21558_c0_g1~~TRINITY_DN21558_c0_g1_i2.p1  ORF type:complete len:1193 (-),score=238.94 TRINITY_DN21558_c0_g1_i2:100-3678(-)
MLCSRGHRVNVQSKRLRLFSWYSCDVCQQKISQRGGRYHKCSAGCDFRVCGICYKEDAQKSYVLEPCTFAFPDGLGPFSISRTKLKPSDLQAFDLERQRSVNPTAGGSWALRESYFSSSRNLSEIWSALVQNRVVIDGNMRGLVVHLSPAGRVNLPLEVRKKNYIPEGPGILVAFMYPVSLDWNLLVGTTGQDDNSPEWSFITAGGFVYMQQSAEDPEKVSVLCANAISYHPRGSMQFSQPLPWNSELTEQLKRKKRWHKVTVQKWASEGAKWFCFLCPEEKLLAPKGRHGGIAVLFHELDEFDEAGRDRFFEIVGKVVHNAEDRTVSHLNLQGYNQGSNVRRRASGPEMLQSALRFRVIGDAPASPAFLEQSTKRCFKAASEGRWALLNHILAENPHLATAVDEQEGRTVLHCIALGKPGQRRARELLQSLHSHGADLEVEDNAGHRAYDLGDQTFKAIACQLWGLVPDLFADPEVWFDYWDEKKTGHLAPEELIPALAAAYKVGDLGRQWIETYVHTHYRELAALDPDALLTKHAFQGNNGLLQNLQSSEEFISLRGQEDSPGKKMPAVFRTEGRKKPTANDQEAIAKFSKALEALRSRYGWHLGQNAPEKARDLEVKAPFAGGDSDPEQRMKTAREMLAWSFARTTARSGQEWLQGFKISFTGNDAGIDHGGLTKAWVQEIAHALWGDESFFDLKDSGMFFKPDSTTDVWLHCFHVKTESLYRWVGRFLAYALYHDCILDCRLSPWVLRWLLRVVEAQAQVPLQLKELAGQWVRSDEDRELVATIYGTVLLSHAEEGGLPPMIPLSMRGNDVVAHIDGEEHTASINGGVLQWSDGDVWVRCPEAHVPKVAALPTWPETSLGDDQLLEDLATMDPAFANSLWRVHYEMPDEDLQWLTFSYAGEELKPGGDDIEVSAENKTEYVRLCCKAVLLYSSQKGQQAFSDGFFDVMPPELTTGMPADIFHWLLVGQDEISEAQINALEQLVVPDGLVPKHLHETPEMMNSARWVFQIARANDGRFRSRLFEFWTGSARLPLGGVDAIEPKPRLQVMVSQERQVIDAVYAWEVMQQGAWRPYPPELSAQLSHLLEAGMRQIEIQQGGIRFVIDLGSGQQINTRSGAHSRIRRRQVQQARHVEGPVVVKRIESWPKTRLPEGHTCGNELWIPLCDSCEELANLLHTAVMNFEAGFAMA